MAVKHIEFKAKAKAKAIHDNTLMIIEANIELVIGLMTSEGNGIRHYVMAIER